jgi:hypothetical protein
MEAKLEGERLEGLVEKFERVCRAFMREIRSFLTKLVL